MCEEADQSNERLLQMSLQLKHVRHDPSSLTSPFHCNLCQVPFSGNAPLLQHLHSTKHRKKATQQTAVTAVLAPTSTERSLSRTDHVVIPVQDSTFVQDLSQIAREVKEALKKGHIVEDHGSTTSPYQCTLCLIPLSGLAPLQQHVQSTKHLKKAKARNIYSDTSSTNLLEDDHVTSPSQVSSVSQDLSHNSDVKESLEASHIVEDHGSTTSPYRCTLCLVPLSGLAPLQQHLKSVKHIKKVKARSIHLETSSTNLLEDDHLSPSSRESSVSQDLSHKSDVKESLEASHIVEDHGSTTSPYRCTLCLLPLSGLEPLQQHLKSVKHIKKAKARSIHLGTSSTSLSEDDQFVTPSGSQESLTDQDLPDISDVKEALEKGHVVENKDSTTSPFQCKLCLIPLSGLEPLQQHVKSGKHIRKIPARNIHLGATSRDFSHSEPNFETSTPKNQNIRPVFSSPYFVQDSINKGHVKENIGSLTSPYQCKLCHVPFSGLAPVEEHVKSAKHLRKMQEFNTQMDTPDGSFNISNIETLTPQNNSSQALNANSSLIQDALNKGFIVRDQESTTSPFQCKACSIPLSGMEPMLEHLKSAKHIKKTMDSSLESISTAILSNTLINEKHLQPNSREQSPISSTNNSISASLSSINISYQHVDTQDAVNGVSNETDTVSKSFKLGHVRRATGSSVGSFYCEICQVPLSGEAPLREHVNSPNHAKNLRKNTGAFDMSGLETALLNTGINEEMSSLLKRAVEDGQICKDDSSLSGTYFCKICKVPLNGVKPAEQHIQGTNHLRARQNDNVQNSAKEIPGYKETEDSLKTSKN